MRTALTTAQQKGKLGPMNTVGGISGWMDDVAPAAGRPLGTELQTEVVIVGGGLTGLSSALALMAEGRSVAVLDAETAGYGASGRNAGHLTPTIGKDLPTLARLYGQERTRAFITFTEAAISEAERLIEEHAIDCDYEAVGNVIAAVDSCQYRAIDRAAEVAGRFGLPGQLLDGAAMRERGIPRSFTRGYLEPHGGILDPAKYVRGLRQAAERAGAMVFDRSKVTGIDDNATGIVVRTDGGSVRAQHCLVATNAYTPELGMLSSTALPLNVQLFSTEPLTTEQLSRLPWNGRQGVYTAHEALESYRLTRDNRIVGGSKTVRYGFGGKRLADVDPRVARAFEELFYQRFPELHDVRIARHWGGIIFLAIDFLPSVGHLKPGSRILHCLAYAGHGLAHASYAGRMVADLLAGRQGPGQVLWSRKTFKLPPEPLRWLVFHALNGGLSLPDRRADWRVRRSL